MYPQYTTKDIKRFWQKVDKRGPDDCWEWLARRKHGHGSIAIQGKNCQAHRVAYELQYGPIPDGLVVRHKCNFAPCCNPAHLELGTQRDNICDRYANKEPIKPDIHPMPDTRPWAPWMGYSTQERFWNYIQKTNTCWNWIGPMTKAGYGRFNVAKRRLYAHRFSWELHNGPIPAGMEILHSCDRPCCVNPAHLSLGNHKDNMSDMATRGRYHIPGYTGEKHPRAKVTNAQVIAIREEYATGNTTAQSLGDKYGISKSAILFIVHNRHWVHIPGPETLVTDDQKGENNPASKLTESQVLAIRSEYVPNIVGAQRLANKYGVSKPTIQRILNGETWSHV